MAYRRKETLSDLIKKLSSGERRHIARLLGNRNGSNQLVKLFKFLCKNPDATQSQIARHLKIADKNGQVSVLKNMLFNNIVDILTTQYGSDYSKRKEMLWEVMRLNTLLEYEQYQYVLEEAEVLLEQALKQGFHSVAIELILLMFRAHSRTDYVYTSNEVLNDFQRSVKHIQKDFVAWISNMIARFLADYTYSKAGYKHNNDREIHEIEKWLYTAEQDNSFPTHSHYLRAFFLLESLKDKSTQKTTTKIESLLNSLSDNEMKNIASNHPVLLGYLLHDYALMLAAQDRAQEAIPYIDWIGYILSISHSSKQTRQRLETVYTVAGLYVYDILKKWEELPKQLRETLDSLIRQFEIIAKYRSLVIYLRYMRLKFNVMSNMLDDAGVDAEFFMEKQPHINNLSARHIFANALLLSAVFYYRIKDFDNLMNAVRRAERRLKSLNLLAEDNANAIRFLKWLYYHPLTEEKIRQEQQKMSALEPSFQLLDHNDWINLFAQCEVRKPGRQIYTT